MPDRYNDSSSNDFSSSFEVSTSTNLTDAELESFAMIAGGVSFVLGLIMLVVIIVTLAALWKIFVKARQPGWAALVPVYNIYVLLQIVGRPVWFLVLYFIPVAQIVVLAVIALDLAKSFGRSQAFGIFLNFLLPPIGWLIIAFGSSQYQGPAVEGAVAPTAQV